MHLYKPQLDKPLTEQRQGDGRATFDYVHLGVRHGKMSDL